MHTDIYYDNDVILGCCGTGIYYLYVTDDNAIDTICGNQKPEKSYMSNCKCSYCKIVMKLMDIAPGQEEIGYVIIWMLNEAMLTVFHQKTSILELFQQYLV